MLTRAPISSPIIDVESHYVPEVNAPAVLLLGAPGSGKTHSISTILRAKIRTFVIITEPRGVDTLLDATPADCLEFLHYRVIAPSRPGFTALEAIAKDISLLDFEALSKKGPTPRRDAQMLQVLATLKNFRCDRTGKEFGDASLFPTDTCVVIDSLSGLNLMAMDLTIGSKVTAHVGEWGVAMSLLDKLLLSCTSNLKGLFVLTAHLERESDELTGATRIMASTLGKKLAPRIPRFFSEVILCKRSGTNYLWSTLDSTTDLKHRALQISDKLPPDFAPILENYQKRLAAITSKPKPSTVQ
jgi:hypothetical protein